MPDIEGYLQYRDWFVRTGPEDNVVIADFRSYRGY